VARALAVLMQDKDSDAIMNEWVTLARTALKSSGSPWADPYAPETLRLVAVIRELQRTAPTGQPSSAVEQASRAIGAAQDAAAMADDAAAMLSTIRARFPTAAAFARADQARYQLWAAPHNPDDAIAVQRQALELWPAYGPAEQRRAFQEDLSTFLLAAGREKEARANLRALFPAAGEKALDRYLVSHLGALAQWFIDAPPLARPMRFEELMSRLVELEPNMPMVRMTAARLALERGNDAAALGHLEQLRQISDPPRFANAVRFLLDRFPNNAALRLLAEQVFGPSEGETDPDRPGQTPTRPTTEPATLPAQ